MTAVRPIAFVSLLVLSACEQPAVVGLMEGAGGSASATGGGGSGMAGAGGAGIDSPLVPSIEMAQLSVSCTQVDPLSGDFTARYDNGAGTTSKSAVVTDARLAATDGGSVTGSWNFPVMPIDSGSVAGGEVVDVVHVKSGPTRLGQQGPCAFCGFRAGTWSLEVSWDVAGMAVSDSVALPYPCR